jgi:hypothetical protein
MFKTKNGTNIYDKVAEMIPTYRAAKNLSKIYGVPCTGKTNGESVTFRNGTTVGHYVDMGINWRNK